MTGPLWVVHDWFVIAHVGKYTDGRFNSIPFPPPVLFLFLLKINYMYEYYIAVSRLYRLCFLIYYAKYHYHKHRRKHIGNCIGRAWLLSAPRQLEQHRRHKREGEQICAAYCCFVSIPKRNSLEVVIRGAARILCNTQYFVPFKISSTACANVLI